MYLFFPETAGRSLEEIDGIFVEANSILDAVQVAKRMPRTHLADLGVEKVGKVDHEEYMKD